MKRDKFTDMEHGAKEIRQFVEVYLTAVSDTGDGWLNYDRSTRKAFLTAVVKDMLISLDSGILDDYHPDGSEEETK